MKGKRRAKKKGRQTRESESDAYRPVQCLTYIEGAISVGKSKLDAATMDFREAKAALWIGGDGDANRKAYLEALKAAKRMLESGRGEIYYAGNLIDTAIRQAEIGWRKRKRRR